MFRHTFIAILACLAVSPVSVAGAQPVAATPAGGVLTLADLEQMALHGNPTLAQADAQIAAARGRASQAGLLPNPTIGYSADEVSRGPVIRGGEHGIFAEQTIPLGGKLGLSRRIFERQGDEAAALRDVQQQRILNDVRALFYSALAADRRVELRQTLVALAAEATGVSRQLYNTGAADQPDILASEIETRELQLSLEAAQNDRFRVWRRMAAFIGNPSLTPRPLDGSIDAPVPELQRDEVLAKAKNQSPEIRAARAAVAQAEAGLARAQREPMPDLILRGGPRYNRELLESNGRPVGWEAAFEIGLTVPLFNRNQGAVAENRAEISRAQGELSRLELTLESRAADAFDDYLTNLRRAETYRTEILPRAEQAFRLYLARYRDMAAAYPQVLVAQRTWIEASDQYVNAAEAAWVASFRLDGLLLEGGLDAPMRVGDTSGATEGIPVRATGATVSGR